MRNDILAKFFTMTNNYFW